MITIKRRSFRLPTFIFFLFSSLFLQAQNTRINDRNSIGWYNYIGTFRLNGKVGIHTEYQWRRDNVISDEQQGLLRVGLNYQFHPKAQLRVGYAWAETAPYGDIPINGLGKHFTEHRIFEMLTLNDKIGIVEIAHRFMLEQRWVGRYTRPELSREDEYPFLNRFRYMARFQVPLKGRAIGDKTPYFAAYDEILIGFGKNVNENVFDQNRIGLLLGYRFNKTLRLEAGYINQILQLGREVDGRNVFQHNSGVILNLIFNFNLEKKS